MISRTRCLICNCKGKTIINFSIKNLKLKSFFLNYYGKRAIVKNFLSMIKNYKYVLLKCSKCEFIWQKYSLNSKLQEVLYDKLISSKKSLKKNNKNFAKFKMKYNSEFDLFKNVHFKKSLKILDYGAGWGSWILALNYNLKCIFALETSRKRIKFLRSKKIQTIDLKSLYKKKLKFDFIRLEQVLEHIDDFDKVIRNLRGIINPSGLLYISVPNSRFLFKDKWRQNLLIKGPAQPLEHLNSFTNSSLKKLMIKYNFKKVSTFSLFVAFVRNNRFSFRSLKTFLRVCFNNFNSTSILFKI